MKKSRRRRASRSADPRRQVLDAIEQLEQQGLKLPRKGPQSELEALTDLLLEPPGKRGRKVSREYPWLTPRQLDTRIKQSPLCDPQRADRTGPKRLTRRPVGDTPDHWRKR